MSPEHLHLILSHIPMVGLSCALFPLLIGLLARSYPALISGLLLAFVCGWSVFLVNQTGEQAKERFIEASQHSIRLDKDALRVVEMHSTDAAFLSRVMYAAAGVATLGLLLCVARSSWAYPIGWVVFILCAGSLVAGILIADSGYKIRRDDLRASTQMQSATEHYPDTFHRGLDV
jgi:hypothetical protein